MVRTTTLYLFAISLLGGVGCAKPTTTPSTHATDVAERPGIDDQGTPIAESVRPRVLGTLPTFSLTDQLGETVTLGDLRGSVWIANFIFTRCVTTCPQQTARLADLQEELKKHGSWETVRLVSFTVDPAHDSPDVLAAYAQKYGADSQHWKFLTGQHDSLWSLSREGFKLPVSEDLESTEMPIFHSAQFVLVDRRGRIRGYFDSSAAGGMRRLRNDLEIVLQEPDEEDSDSASTLPPLPYPEDVIEPTWLEGRKREQLATKDKLEIECGFRFTDAAVESGITFEQQSVEYSSKSTVAAHYDHGNGIAVADVDGDGLLDIYLATQIGSNELWKNIGGGRFQNVTPPEIMLADVVGVSASFADTDNDGDPDLFVTSVREGNRFFENIGDGRFAERTQESGLGYKGHSSSGVFFDFDRDGLLDLFLCNVGVYTKDEKDGNGVYPPFADAFAGHLKPSERNEKSILYKNVGNNRFVDVSEQTGLIDVSWTGDASPLDVNEDGWLDLYVLNMQGHDEYYENVEGRRFEKRSREVFPQTSWGAMGIKVFDFDNDGRLDIYVTDMHSDMSQPVAVGDEKQKSVMRWPESFLKSEGKSVFGNTFFHKQSDGRFTEISDKIGAENYWPWGLSIGDLNADGFADVFIASSMNYPFRYCVNSVLLNERGKRFVDSEFILGVEPRKNGQTAQPNFTLDPLGEDQDNLLVQRLTLKEPVEVWGALGSRSSAIFDLDNDGDLDVVTNEFNDGPLVLVSNLADSMPIHWLKVELRGTKSNRDGLGAIVRLHTNGVEYTQVQDGKSGYLSQSTIPLYFGLDSNENVEKLEILWPSGNQQTVVGPFESNRQVTVEEE